MNPNTQKMIAAARLGGTVLKNYFGQLLETTQKSTVSDFRTRADLESEEAILGELIAQFPTYNIFSEEAGEVNNGSEFTFVIDPLDGTNNFVLGLPNFCISIGLMKGKELWAGVIYVPMIDQMYWAEKGQGAFLNDQRLHVNAESDIKRATITHNCGYTTPATKEMNVFSNMYARDVKRMMMNWAPTFDFCMLAAGRIEGIIVNNIELYDFAAGKLITQEAGAKSTDFSGQPETNETNNHFILSNNTAVHDTLVEAMSTIEKS